MYVLYMNHVEKMETIKQPPKFNLKIIKGLTKSNT